ncbi:MAG: transcription repressor NadR [Caldicoprobacterales bacterium]|jgi:transcriptional regulator of NAD metabolism|nr:transcription repressor NadR [Clostridiales bacterium]
MTSEQRREKIAALIERSSSPLTGAYLAKLYNVSRQIIVQDIAILRAAGLDIIATPQGYIMPRTGQQHGLTRVIAVKHGQEEIGDELYLIVDLGGKILDVMVEHPVYGEFKARLMLATRNEVSSYLAAMRKEEAEPLSALTEGVHLHTIEADSIDVLNRIEEALKQKGYLLD